MRKFDREVPKAVKVVTRVHEAVEDMRKTIPRKQRKLLSVKKEERSQAFSAVKYHYVSEKEVDAVDLAEEGQTITVFAVALDELLFSDEERMKHTMDRTDQNRLNWLIDVRYPTSQLYEIGNYRYEAWRKN